MRTVLRTAAVTFLIVLGIQVFPVTRDNPPVTGTIEAPAPVATILRRACFDCHSNETVWPWYSHVAPAKWLVANDVHQGRAHVNFSTWTSLSPDEQRKHLLKMAEEVEKGAMPPGIYTPLHPEARMGLQDINAVATWAKGSAK